MTGLLVRPLIPGSPRLWVVWARIGVLYSVSAHGSIFREHEHRDVLRHCGIRWVWTLLCGVYIDISRQREILQ